MPTFRYLAVEQKQHGTMQKIWPVALRTVIVMAIFGGLQFLIYYPFLVGGGLLAGGFMFKTSDDRPLALGSLIGTILFGLWAYFYGTA